MLIPSAKSRTPLKKAPSNWARCQPKDRAFGDSSASDTWSELSTCCTFLDRAVDYLESNERDNKPDQVVQLDS